MHAYLLWSRVAVLTHTAVLIPNSLNTNSAAYVVQYSRVHAKVTRHCYDLFSYWPANNLLANTPTNVGPCPQLVLSTWLGLRLSLRYDIPVACDLGTPCLWPQVYSQFVYCSLCFCRSSNSICLWHLLIVLREWRMGSMFVCHML